MASLSESQKAIVGIFEGGGDTHSITYVPASTSLTLPIPLGTRFCDAFLALSAGRDGRGDMGTGREEGGGEAEEALYWLWTGGRAEEGHVQRGKNRGQSGKARWTKWKRINDNFLASFFCPHLFDICAYNIHERRQLQRQDHLGRPRHLVRCPRPTLSPSAPPARADHTHTATPPQSRSCCIWIPCGMVPASLSFVTVSFTICLLKIICRGLICTHMLQLTRTV